MRWVFVMSVVVRLLACAPVLADDFAPPPWRDAELSRTDKWDGFWYGDFESGIRPEYRRWVDDWDPATVPYTGLGGTHLDFDDPNGWVWSSDPDDPQGGAMSNPERDAMFVANVENWVDWMPEKQLRVQITYTDAMRNGSPLIVGLIGFGPVSGGDPHHTIFRGRVDVDANHYYEDYTIVPNPDWEQIEFYLPQGTVVEQIIIDTVSPEPGTLSLLALGALAVMRQRRRS